MKVRQKREIKLTSDQLRKLQLVELDILLEVDRICREYNISYFLCGGTLLGAVRHKGFIPWDDDVDVGFLRADYERFCQVFAQKADGAKYFLQTWKTDQHYRWSYGKIRRLGTEYIRSGQEHMKYVTGISIDIFPYDYLPVDEELQKQIIVKSRLSDGYKYVIERDFLKSKGMREVRKQAFTCGVLRKILYSVVGKYQVPQWHMRVLYCLLSLIPGRLVVALLEKSACKYNASAKYKGGGIRQFGYANDITIPSLGWCADKMKEYSEVEFEGFKFLSLKDTHWYLRGTYGVDYMAMPPQEMRHGVAPVTEIRFGNVFNEMAWCTEDYLRPTLQSLPQTSAKPMSTVELRTLQLTELELLLEFDRICRKNNIRYSIIGGTLLGAVRHQGFIPWDDDADVALLRSDYELFVSACEYDLDNGRFYFHDQFRTEGYRWGFGKLRRRGTSFVRPATEHMPYEQGVYIDIMPVDYIPNSRIGQLICNMQSFCFRKTAWAEVGRHTETNRIIKVAYQLLSFIPLRTTNSIYARFIQKTNSRPTAYLRCLAVPVVTSYGQSGYWRYKSDWMDNLVDYDFEGYKLMGFADFDLPLHRMYGNYMTPVKFSPVSYSAYKLPLLDEIQVDNRLKEKVGLVDGEI